MSHPLWKPDWQTTRAHYLDWWAGRGLVISMWEHLEVDGIRHETAPAPPPARDLDQRWFDADWRAADIHYRLSRSELRADILPVANTQLGPGSLAAVPRRRAGRRRGHHLARGDGAGRARRVRPRGPWLRAHLDLVGACRQRADGRYFVGCPDLMEGLDTLATMRGVVPVMEQIVADPEGLERDLQAVNDIWFDVFERIYDVINVDGEMAFCYFSLWSPGRMAKLQCDVSIDDLARPLPTLRACPSSRSSAGGSTTRCTTSMACRPSVTSMPCWRSRSSTRCSGRRAWGSLRAATRPGSTSTAGSGQQASPSRPAGCSSTSWPPCSMPSGPTA